MKEILGNLMKIMWYDWKLIDAVSKVENELWTSAPVALFKSALHFPEYTCLCGAYCDVFPLGVSFIEVCVGWEPKYFNQAHLFKSNIFFFFFCPNTIYSTWLAIIEVQYVYTWSIYFVDVSWCFFFSFWEANVNTKFYSEADATVLFHYCLFRPGFPSQA